MPRVGYVLPMQGFRPKTNPKPLAGLRGLGANNAFSGCVQGYDADSNPVSCGDPSAVVWMDANGNTVAAGASAPMPAGGAPTGSILRYQGTWQVTPTLNVNTLLSRVSQAVQAYGLQFVTESSTGGALTVGNFNVALALQVTGSGFAQPADAGSIVDHAYYTVAGRMPVSSSTFLQSSGSSVPSNVPSSPNNPAASAPSWATWLETNALWLGLGVLAVAVGPALVKKL